MRASGFISKAACRGYRPQRFASHNGRQRPHLIARLAKERGIARFVVAPDGYGKTSLVIDYADTMFGWEHVFFINAKSPCFIRDLDSGCIASSCFEVDSEAKLVVIDDVPQLDMPRVTRLSEEIDLLLERDCEVIVSCTPSCDLLGSLQFDRMRICASDLLLTDEELDAMRSEEERMRAPTVNAPAAKRVPVLVWGATQQAVDAFVSGSFGENLPADLLLATCNVFVLQRGSFADLAQIGPIDASLAADTLADYPHLGLDVHEGSFEAPLVDIGVLYRAAKSKLDAMVERSRFATREELVRAWADILLARGAYVDRACDVARAFFSSKDRASWLLAHVREIVRWGGFYALIRLVRSLKGGQHEVKYHLLAIEALCLRMLGDEQSAILYAKRCAFQANVPNEARVVSLLILTRFARGELNVQAADMLKGMASSLPESAAGRHAWHEVLVLGWAASTAGLAALGKAWSTLHDEHVDEDMLCIVASWLFGLVSEAWNTEQLFDAHASDAAEQFIRDRLGNDGAGSDDFFAASAGLSMEQAHLAGMPYAEGPLPASVLLGLRRVETAVLVQRGIFERDQRVEQARRASRNASGSLYGGKRTNVSPSENRAVPLMELKMFGRLDVSIGGVPVSQKRIARKQVRVLLVLLVANRGRDLSRESVAQAMWPSREPENARKNFYTTWSQLRKALSLEDGSCPYLIRHQYGCRLDERHVRSDYARFDDICRELQFGRVNFEEWIDLYAEIDRDFSGEILPFEEQNHLIAEVRVDCLNRLVDALVTAAERLTEAGGPQHAIWFARKATERARTREDAYMALMRAQIAHGQRTAAMMTYFTCKRILSDELGIDPSPEMTELYESLLGS